VVWRGTAREWNFVGIEEGSECVLGYFESVCENSWVDSFGSVTEGLGEEFT